MSTQMNNNWILPSGRRLVAEIPTGALRIWYFSGVQAKEISKDLIFQTETFEYFLITERRLLKGILAGHLGRIDHQFPFFRDHQRNLTYFDDYSKRLPGVFTFDGITHYRCEEIQPGMPLLFVLKDINMDKNQEPVITSGITVQGNHNLVNTGSHNQIRIEHNTWKGDIEALKTELARHQISSEDIAEIAQIVMNDQPNPDSKMPDKAVPWINKMLTKAVQGSWDIATHTAGSLLAEIIKGYYF